MPDHDLFGWEIPEIIPKPKHKRFISGYLVTWKKSGRIIKVIYKVDEKELAKEMAERNGGTIKIVYNDDLIELANDEQIEIR